VTRKMRDARLHLAQLTPFPTGGPRGLSLGHRGSLSIGPNRISESEKKEGRH
jgi:hypothetical protein